MPEAQVCLLKRSSILVTVGKPDAAWLPVLIACPMGEAPYHEQQIPDKYGRTSSQ